MPSPQNIPNTFSPRSAVSQMSSSSYMTMNDNDDSSNQTNSPEAKKQKTDEINTTTRRENGNLHNPFISPEASRMETTTRSSTSDEEDPDDIDFDHQENLAVQNESAISSNDDTEEVTITPDSRMNSNEECDEEQNVETTAKNSWYTNQVVGDYYCCTILDYDYDDQDGYEYLHDGYPMHGALVSISEEGSEVNVKYD